MKHKGVLTVVAIALLLLGWWFNVPGTISEWSHRNDVAWQEQHHPTTTTTVFVPLPPSEPYVKTMQQNLTEIVDSLEGWDAEVALAWREYSATMQTTYKTGNYGPAPLYMIHQIMAVTDQWENVISGDHIDFEDPDGPKAYYERDPLDGPPNYATTQMEIYKLIDSIDQCIHAIDDSFLYIFRASLVRPDDWPLNKADAGLLKSWEKERTSLEFAISSLRSTTDQEYLRYYIAIDKAAQGE